jgi:hypothetical protein
LAKGNGACGGGNGRWAVCGLGRDPVEIASGDVFRVEGDDGALRITRMEYTPGRGYYAVDGSPLRTGLRAAIRSGD